MNEPNPVVVEILERCRLNGDRIRVFYGDTETGRDWGEENDVIGYVGRSTGTNKIPLLLYNRRSDGGGAILTRCIVKIMRNDGAVLYACQNYHHPNYHLYNRDAPITLTDGRILTVRVDSDYPVAGTNVANFETWAKAIRWVNFLKGKRFSK